MSGRPVSQQVSFLWLCTPPASQSQAIKWSRVTVSASFLGPPSPRPPPTLLKVGQTELYSRSPFTSNPASHSYLQATWAERRSLIKAECCPDLSPFPFKCRVLCSMRKSFAARFNEPSVEPVDLMTCENINLLAARVPLPGKPVYYSSRGLAATFFSLPPRKTPLHAGSSVQEPSPEMLSRVVGV